MVGCILFELQIPIVFLLSYLFHCVFLCFAEAPSAFGESSHLALTIVFQLVVLFIVVPLHFVVGDNPNATLLLRGIGQSLCSLIITSVLFGPKLYIIWQGHADDPRQFLTYTPNERLKDGHCRPGRTSASLAFGEISTVNHDARGRTSNSNAHPPASRPEREHARDSSHEGQQGMLALHFLVCLLSFLHVF